MAENTNVGMAVFVEDITYYDLCVVSFLRARLSAAAVSSLSSPVLRCCSSTLCDQLQCLKEGLYIIQILCRRHPFWSNPAGLTIADPPG